MSVDGSVLRHGWWSLRGRFRIALVVVVLHAAAVAVIFGRFGGDVPAEWEMDAGDRASVERVIGGSYDRYLRQTWAGGDLGGLLVVLGVVLAVGGAAAERRQGTADLTLSLPAPRSRWILARCGLVLGLLLLLAAVSALVVVLGGLLLGAAVPGGVAAATVPLAGLGPAYAVALALLATTWTRDVIRAALITLAALYVIDATGSAAFDWHPGVVLDPTAWAAGPPWPAVLVAAALTGGFLVLAVRRFTTVDA